MFKKTALFLCLIFMLTSSTGFCWVQSFRSAASGDLFYGDFDNDLDPVYVWDNDGYRIYSTLSNLSSSTDRFASNINNGVYLFGISGGFNLPEFNGWQSRSMFLIQLADSRSDAISNLDIDYNGSNDIVGTGYMSSDYVQFFDNNNDNIYDARADYTATADNYDLLKKRDWNLVHSYNRGNSTIGISFAHLGYGNNYCEDNNHSNLFTFTNPLHTFSYSNSRIQTDLSTQTVGETANETGDFLTTYETPANIIRFSLETPFYMINDSEFRFDLAYNMFTNQYNVTDRINIFRDVSSDSIVDVSNETEIAEVDSSLGGYIIAPAVRLTKHWHKDAYSWFDLSFGVGSYDANKSFVDRYDVELRDENTSGNTEVFIQNFDDLIDQTGDTKHMGFGFYHKTVVDFSEKFSFAAGFDIHYVSEKTDWDADYSTTNIIDFDNGDAVSDENDYVASQVSSMAVNLIDESKTTTINLPVAMEYSMKRWTFRLGAEHTIQHNNVTIDRNIVSSSPVVTVTIDGNNDTTIVTSDNDYLSQGSANETQFSGTNFVYGLEFKANDNLKIELLHFLGTANVDFLNTDFYRQLRLSLTVLF